MYIGLQETEVVYPWKVGEAAYKRQLDAAQTPEEREKLMNDLLTQSEQVRNPIKTAHSFGIEEIIDPRDTRSMIVYEVSSMT